MKLLSFLFLFCGVTYATSYAPLKFPEEPTPDQILDKNGLSGATEDVLLSYLVTRWEEVGYLISDITKREQENISREYFRRIELEYGGADEYLKSAILQLQKDRLLDQRRAVDATIRELGRRGTENSLRILIGQTMLEEREWVRWKSLASSQEIMSRVDPAEIDPQIMRLIPANLFAPLLRDLDPDVACSWAWTLWEIQKKHLGAAFRSNVRLRSRIWLANSFAAKHPQEACEVFREGLQSHDAAIRTATEMIIRSNIGGSLPYNTSDDQLCLSVLDGKWKAGVPIWEAFPLPLNRPLLRKTSEGRRDLIWLSREGIILKNTNDVWPLIREPLTNGKFYSRIGDFFPMEYGLSDSDGILHSRIPSLYSSPTIASHGGVLAISGHHRAAEFHADGSKLWECRLSDQYRKIVSIGGGRVVLLGYQLIECRDRRGDLLWKTKLHLDDPRDIIPVDEDRFLLSCGKTIGWLTRDGKYDPILSGFPSAGWIRYHPVEPWIIFEGSNTTAVIYDPKTNKVTGRIDLDDGWGNEKSRFPFPRTYFPE